MAKIHQNDQTESPALLPGPPSCAAPGGVHQITQRIHPSLQENNLAFIFVQGVNHSLSPLSAELSWAYEQNQF